MMTVENTIEFGIQILKLLGREILRVVTGCLIVPFPSGIIILVDDQLDMPVKGQSTVSIFYNTLTVLEIGILAANRNIVFGRTLFVVVVVFQGDLVLDQ